MSRPFVFKAGRPRHVHLFGRLLGRLLRPEDPDLPGHQVQAQEAGQELGHVQAAHVWQLGKNA